ncbi:MAG: hypothetical protein JRF02_03970 [Deltaproteobacteria bacterium]|jgi:hypothetical protein|nr:hypothetical protein [Deltaproteobacteria bacterium]
MGKTTRDKIDLNDMEELFAVAVDEAVDEAVVEAIEFEDIDISNCVYEPVIVGLKNRKLKSRLEKAFYPQYDREIAVMDTDGNLLILPVEDLQFLAFVNRPLGVNLKNVGNFSEMLETFSRDSFKIQVPGDQDFNSGFFALSTNPETLYKYIFFSYKNIRAHYQLRRLGEIIVQHNLLSDDILQSVINKQYQLRKLRLGTIIARREKLLQRDIEKILQQSKMIKDKSSGFHTGDILIRSGLVPSETVRQSLAIQKQLRRVKLGELLLELGYLNEEQLCRVLAEKFRKRFVNLQKFSTSDKALNRLSKDMARRLQIAPIDFHDNRLIIATPFPDRPEICDILRERLSCPFELVVSPKNQIVEFMANLPG